MTLPVAAAVAWQVCLLNTTVSHAETVEPIGFVIVV